MPLSKWLEEIDKIADTEFGGYCKVTRKKHLGVKNGYEIADIYLECIHPINFVDLERFRNRLEEELNLAIDPGDIEIFAPFSREQAEKLGYKLIIHVKAHKPI